MLFHRRLCRWFWVMVEPYTAHFFINVIVKLYVISDDGRHAAVAELRRADKLEDDVKESVATFRGGF